MPQDNHRLTAFLAVVITLGFFGIVGTLLFHEVPQGSKDILGPLIGVIGASVGTIVGYHWGSSSGSARKSETIEQQMKDMGTGDGTSGTVISDARIETANVTNVNPARTSQNDADKKPDF